MDDDTDNLVGAGQEKEKKLYASLRHIGAVRSKMKAEQGKSYTDTAKLIYPNKNGMVWYPGVSTHTLRKFVHDPSSKTGIGRCQSVLPLKY